MSNGLIFNKFNLSANTRIGGRSENQDSFGWSDTPSGFLVVVCDGMGGGPGGKQASLMATKSIIDYVKDAEDIRKNDILLANAISYANKDLRNYVSEHPEYDGMGTTVTAVLVDANRAVLAHVGDSRIYQFRGHSEIFRTRDHSLIAERVRKGELTEKQAKMSAISNIITRALGPFEDVEAEIDIRGYEKGDRFLLCTDGVWGAVSDKKLKSLVTVPRIIEGAVDGIMVDVDNCGRERGGHHDNLTAAILELKSNSNYHNPMRKKDKILISGLALLVVFLTVLSISLGIKLKDTKQKEAELMTRIERLETSEEKQTTTTFNVTKSASKTRTENPAQQSGHRRSHPRNDNNNTHKK